MVSLAGRLELDLDRKTHELSKGNKLKVGIVQTLMADQELIIMDEPSGLDPLVQQEFYRILRKEKKQGKTIFISSHNLAEVESVCDRVAIIRKCQLVVVEDIRVLREKTGKVLEVELSDLVNIAELNLDGVIEAVSNHRILNITLKSYSLEQLFLEYYAEAENHKRGNA
jgi:ABC-2 type transport system ATP-binding protein